MPLVIGIVWTVSYARLFIGQLNLISAFIFAILLGLDRLRGPRREPGR